MVFLFSYFVVPLTAVEYSYLYILYYISYLTSGIRALSWVGIVGNFFSRVDTCSIVFNIQ
jgi:hypothetical protein